MLWELNTFSQWHLGCLALWVWFSLDMWPDKMDKHHTHSFSLVAGAETNLDISHHNPWAEWQTTAVGSSATSTSFCIHESVFSLHSLINYWPYFVGSCYRILSTGMKLVPFFFSLPSSKFIYNDNMRWSYCHNNIFSDLGRVALLKNFTQ